MNNRPFQFCRGNPLWLPVSKRPQTIKLRYWLLLFLFVFPFVIRAAEVPAKAGQTHQAPRQSIDAQHARGDSLDRSSAGFVR